MPDLPLWVWVLAGVLSFYGLLYLCISDDAAEEFFDDLFGGPDDDD